MKTKRPYTTPALTVVEFKVERGYAISKELSFMENSGDDNVEARQDGQDLGWF